MAKTARFACTQSAFSSARGSTRPIKPVSACNDGAMQPTFDVSESVRQLKLDCGIACIDQLVVTDMRYSI